MDTGQREQLIQHYMDGARLVRQAVALMSDEELDRQDPGNWSPRKIVHHLADADMISATRVRRLVAEEDVHIVAYDEALWARRAHYERPIAAALALVDAVRMNTAEFLRSLTDEEWQREGTHSEAGRYTPEIWLQYYAQHAQDHVAQIEAIGR